MNYDVVIVGGGIAGLTAAAYLCRAGYKVLVCEKEKKTGGLINSFDVAGFTFDGGIRAIENSGIVFPMLKQLGIEIEFVKNQVSIGIENEVINIVSKESLKDYQQLLSDQFPGNAKDISNIINEIKRIMRYMDILYGIDNPLFMDLTKNPRYLVRTILPWLFKYLLTIRKIGKFNVPIYEYLRKFTGNIALIDVIAQHFFKATPAFFALSYFSLYLDYRYPKGGTGQIPERLERFIRDHAGEIRTETEICSVNPQIKQVTDSKGNAFHYRKLIWASDLKKLYAMIDAEALTNIGIKRKAIAQKKAVLDKSGGDSVFTLFLALDIDPRLVKRIASAHFFYTPVKTGLSSISLEDLKINASKRGDCGYMFDKQTILAWIGQYYGLTTYEISCPVMKDDTLAPKGKTGLIVSTLMDHSLVKHIADMGWYEEFRNFSEDCIINVLDKTIFPGIKRKVMNRFTSTPLTLEKMTGNSDGAITGWAFTNSFIPAVNRLQNVARSILTPFPDIFQAGQWTFSPSGFPTSILTGKLAADKVKKQL